MKKVKIGSGIIAAQWGDIGVIGVYQPPRYSLAQFENTLAWAGERIKEMQPRPVILCGDLNAKHAAWGSRRGNARGEAVMDWVAAHGLLIINRGSVSTCQRPQGESIVDITIATPAAARMITGWRVLEKAETLSDHLYIEMAFSSTLWAGLTRRDPAGGELQGPRWTLRKMDEDKLMANVLLTTRLSVPPEDTEPLVTWLGNLLMDACDASMPRAKPQSRRAAYWWNDDIATKRSAAMRARRSFMRARRDKRKIYGGRTSEELHEELKEARKSLRVAIRAAKATAWNELMLTLDEDPWGRPYKIVTKKLHTGAPPITETADPQTMKGILGTLFPQGGNTMLAGWDLPAEDPWEEDLGVDEGELARALRKMRRNKAPGLDGVPGKVLTLAGEYLSRPLGRVYSRCLQRGVFPPGWKRARLVLLKKPGRPDEEASSYRPICLLDEPGKLFERVITNRLVQHLSRVGPDLNGAQYGFREGRSTVDAIKHVRALSEAEVERGRVCLVVSLDIKNAFNTLPWDQIGEALRYHRTPPYLVQVLREYFRDRRLVYRDQTGEEKRRAVERGVPQGSVLGPLIWNIAFDRVVRSALPPGCHTVCYADDTLIIAGGENWGDATALATHAVHCAVRNIKDMGLEVSAAKSEALFIHNPRAPPPPAHVRVDGDLITVGGTLKYLGLLLDGAWSFTEHFKKVAPKAEKAANALAGLMPNLGGPKCSVRRVYAGTILSMVLYAAPVWAADLAHNRRALQALRPVERRLAVRCARSYRTTSRLGAMAVAGILPVAVSARAFAEVYERRRELRGQGVNLSASARDALRLQARRRAMARWAIELDAPVNRGNRAVEAIQPRLEDWMTRGWGEVTYRLAQVITGHGCFGRYLRQIGKEDTAQCHQCGAAEDTAQHTLAECTAFDEQRRVLTRQIGGEDLSLSSMVKAMLEREENWTAVLAYCEAVVQIKEEKERERRGVHLRPPSQQQQQQRGMAGPPTAVQPLQAATQPPTKAVKRARSAQRQGSTTRSPPQKLRRQ